MTDNKPTIVHVLVQPTTKMPLLDDSSELDTADKAELELLRLERSDLWACALRGVFVSANARQRDQKILFSEPSDNDSTAVDAWVIGRHQQCDTGPVTGASLRHALVIFWPQTDDYSAQIEVLDLRTEVGLSLSGGRQVSRLTANKRLRFCVGNGDFSVHLAPPKAGFFSAIEDDENQAKSGDFSASVSSDGPPGNKHFESAEASGGADDDATWYTGKMLDLATVTSRPTNDSLRDADTICELRRGPLHRLTNEPDHLPRYRLFLTSEELEAGVVLGRYERCDDLGRGALPDRVSRVHLLALKRRGLTWVFDLGSMNGTELIDAAGKVTLLGRERRGAVWKTKMVIRIADCLEFEVADPEEEPVT